MVQRISYKNTFAKISVFNIVRNFLQTYMLKVLLRTHSNNWWLVRVTLVVAFGFLPQKFGRWQGSMNCHFAQKGMQFCGADNVRWWGHSNGKIMVKDGKKISTLCTHRWWGSKNFPIFPSSRLLALAPHTSHLMKLSLPNI